MQNNKNSFLTNADYQFMTAREIFNDAMENSGAFYNQGGIWYQKSTNDSMNFQFEDNIDLRTCLGELIHHYRISFKWDKNTFEAWLNDNPSNRPLKFVVSESSYTEDMEKLSVVLLHWQWSHD